MVPVGLTLRADQQWRQEAVISSGAQRHSTALSIAALLPLPASGARLRKPLLHIHWNALVVAEPPYTARTSTTPGTALMAPAICGLTL